MVIFSLALCFCACGSTVKIDTNDKAVARFAYGDKDIETGFADEDFKEIATIFEGKSLTKDAPACSSGEGKESALCPFNDNIGVIIGDNHFCIANDNCGVVYFKEKDKYFSLADEEKQKLRALLEGYGFTFPCA